MMNLHTQKQCFDLAKQAGFTDAQAEIMSAIAMVESLSFNNGVAYADADKIGDVSLANATWGYSYGLWQVRSLRADYGTGRTRDAARLPDPVFNAKSARAIFTSSGFGAWSTYTSDAYLAYMQKATYNPKPVLPAGSYMVVGGDTLSGIGNKTTFPWRLIAAVNRVKSPYTIYPGQIILLPDFPYKVVSGDTLSGIASKVSEVTWQRIAEYNKLTNPNALSIGQELKIPRYTSWDGTTLVL
jgi:nucleoid-associated protein YgaU